MAKAPTWVALLGCWVLIGCGPAESEGENPESAAPLSTPLMTCRGAPYPIILAHGMAGFELIGSINYFYDVAADLRARGETVFESQVPPYDSSTVRAAKLAQVVDSVLASTGSCKVNLVAHSQGGIDARYLISTLRYGDRVGGLVTVGTPHRGTPVADVALGLVPGFSADIVNGLLLAVQGLTSNDTGNPNIRANLQQLSTDSMRQFNLRTPDDSRVKYYSVTGRSNLASGGSECAGSSWGNPWGLDAVNPLLAAPAAIFPFFSPNPFFPIANDGLVSVASARWGQFLGCFAADHFDEVGQIAETGPDLLSGYYHIHLYRRIVTQLHSASL